MARVYVYVYVAGTEGCGRLMTAVETLVIFFRTMNSESGLRSLPARTDSCDRDATTRPPGGQAVPLVSGAHSLEA